MHELGQRLELALKQHRQRVVGRSRLDGSLERNDPISRGVEYFVHDGDAAPAQSLDHLVALSDPFAAEIVVRLHARSRSLYERRWL
jgi:hypothetical protein